MSATVLPFTSLPTHTETDIPTPVYYQPGDEFYRLDITDLSCSIVGLYPGAVCIFQRGLILDGALHLFTLKREPVVSRLQRLPNGRVRHGADLSKGEICALPESDIYGVMSEFYPVGLSGPRWIIHQPARSWLQIPNNPHILTAQADPAAYVTG